MGRNLSTCQAAVTLGKGSLSIPANDTDMLEDNCNVQVISKCCMSSGGAFLGDATWGEKVGNSLKSSARSLQHAKCWTKQFNIAASECQLCANWITKLQLYIEIYVLSDLCVSCNCYLASFTVCCCDMKHAAVWVSACAAVEAYLLIREQKNPVFKIPWIVIQHNAYLYFAWPLRTLQRQSA